MKQISGNKLLVRALKEEGVDTIFGYPGACTIDISDELYKQDDIRIILPRHEQALVHEADAYARTTGKVGVCLVTSGPGATNLVTGLATANYDSVPLVCFTGQVARPLIVMTPCPSAPPTSSFPFFAGSITSGLNAYPFTFPLLSAVTVRPSI